MTKMLIILEKDDNSAQNSDTNKYWEGGGKVTNHTHYWQRSKVVQPLGNQAASFSNLAFVRIAYSILGAYLRELKT